MSRLAPLHSTARRAAHGGWIAFFLAFSAHVQALPAFARQTGQSCVACHAGGQFPELTPYGRMFKLTGYTTGTRGIPLSVMGIVSETKAKQNHDAMGAPIAPNDSNVIADGASLFIAGKVTERVGLFSQFTYLASDPGTGKGHFGSDNFDLRYADRFVTPARDIVWGVTLHNNPGMQDVWNSSTVWGYPYIGSSQGAFGGAPYAPVLEGALAQQAAGVTAYAYFNQHFYVEAGAYKTADGMFSFLSIGNKSGSQNYPQTFLDGYAPYFRLAYTQEWGAHNVMVGVTGLDVLLVPLDSLSHRPLYGVGTTDNRDIGFDVQYQYLLAPHTLTAAFRIINEAINDKSGQAGYAGPLVLNSLMAKVSYVYRARYGVSAAVRHVSGSRDPAYAVGDGTNAYTMSALGSPDTTVWTPELFWLPMENIRVGFQYNFFTKYLGASSNYDGNGRNASDNNAAFLYFWVAF